METFAGVSLYSLLSLFVDKCISEKLPAVHELMAWSVFQAHMHQCLLCHSALLWVFREQVETRGVHSAAKAFTSSRDCTNPPPVWAMDCMHPSQYLVEFLQKLAFIIKRALLLMLHSLW